MPTREYSFVNVVVPDGEFGFGHEEAAPFATLEDTGVVRDEVWHPSFGTARRITVAYTLSLNDQTFTHLYEFYTEVDDPGQNHAWEEFVSLITSDDCEASLIYHAKRNGSVMTEFLELCEECEQHAAAA
jgi:hypothetical protein